MPLISFPQKFSSRQFSIFSSRAREAAQAFAFFLHVLSDLASVFAVSTVEMTTGQI
jgi:hypothetical protein